MKIKKEYIMTKKELIVRLDPFDDNGVVIISDGAGWCNIERLEQQGNNIALLQEKYPVFSDN